MSKVIEIGIGGVQTVQVRFTMFLSHGEAEDFKNSGSAKEAHLLVTTIDTRRLLAVRS